VICVLPPLVRLTPRVRPGTHGWRSSVHPHIRSHGCRSHTPHIQTSVRSMLTESPHWGRGGVCVKYHSRVVFSTRCRPIHLALMLRCQCTSVCPSVSEVHWRIIANLGFKFRSQFTVHAFAVHAGREH